MGRVALALLLGSLTSALCTSAARGAEADLPDSRDPHGVDRYPRSWIVDYEHDDDVRSREFIMSRVDRIRREVVVDETLHLDAILETVTYQIPRSASVDDVVSHYVDEIGGDLLFQCDGRDCGRSSDWANQVFGQAILYGPDRNQRYLAFEWQDTLVALYATRRGNQRVYAHLRFLSPDGPVGLEPNALLVRRLSERGWAPIDAVQPRPDGSLDAQDLRVLEELAGSLSRFRGRPLHLVCHLPGSPAARILELTQRCADAAAQAVSGGGEGGTALEVRGFGAGPLLPRPNLPAARLEMVLLESP